MLQLPTFTGSKLLFEQSVTSNQLQSDYLLSVYTSTYYIMLIWIIEIISGTELKHLLNGDCFQF